MRTRPRRATGEPIATEDENVTHSARLEIVQGFQPETRAFGFFNPQAEHFLFAGEIDAQHRVDAFFEHALIGAHRHAQAIDKDDGIDGF